MFCLKQIYFLSATNSLLLKFESKVRGITVRGTWSLTLFFQYRFVHYFRSFLSFFHFGSVYSLFHPTFYSYAIISNIRTSNLAKSLSVNASYSSDNTGRWPPCISCGEIKSSMCFKIVSKSSTLIQNIFLKTYRYYTMSSFIMFWKEPNWCLRLNCWCVLHPRGFSSSESTSSDSITGKSMSFAIFHLTSNEKMNELACWMKQVGWHIQTI